MVDLNAKLEGARRNVAALQETLAQKRQEAENANTLLVKWIGVTEYLSSLIRDEEKAAQEAKAAEGGGEDSPQEVPALSNGHGTAPRLEGLPGGAGGGKGGGEGEA